MLVTLLGMVNACQIGAIRKHTRADVSYGVRNGDVGQVVTFEENALFPEGRDRQAIKRAGNGDVATRAGICW